MMIAMLKPILINFTIQMNDEEIDRMIKILKAIIAYLEKEDEGVKQDEKEVASCTG